VSRSKAPTDQPDAVLSSVDGRRWVVFCRLCPRTLGRGTSDAFAARAFASEHLEHSHGLKRVWIEQHRPGYTEAVQEGLPLVLAHHTQRIDRVRAR
jgi:hypothetical protein